MTSIAVADGSPGTLVISGHFLDQVRDVTLGERVDGSLGTDCVVDPGRSNDTTLVCDWMQVNKLPNLLPLKTVSKTLTSWPPGQWVPPL